MTEPAAWRRCSNCKRYIALGAVHWVCSVSTCNRKRTGLVFCTTECWDAHLPLMRHREAWAIEATAPDRAAPASGASKPAPAREPRRRVVRPEERPAERPAPPREVLIVASRLKDYVRARSDMNTSDAVLDVLSDKVRLLCDRAIANARRAGRKTVLDRDL